MKLYAYQNKNFAPFHYSSCVEETTIPCDGTSVCDNKEDLRQCKNESLWRSLSDVIGSEYVQCPGSGQWIKSGSKNDGIFDCLNRRDEEETTFKKANSDNETSLNATQDWLKEVHKLCPNKTSGGPYYNNGKNWRRCLGNQPDICVYSKSKFLLIIIRHFSKVKHTIGLLPGIIFLHYFNM